MQLLAEQLELQQIRNCSKRSLNIHTSVPYRFLFESPFSRDRERTFLCVSVTSGDGRSASAQLSPSVASFLWAGKKETAYCSIGLHTNKQQRLI